MRPPRFRLISLIAFVVGIAVALGGLRESTPFWAEVFKTAIFATLAVAALRTIALREARRIYWAGFLIAGTVYLVATWNPAMSTGIITDRGLDILGQVTRWTDGDSNYSIRLANPNNQIGRRVNTQRLSFSIEQYSGRSLDAKNSACFYIIGHYLFALTSGMLGGWYARRLWIADRVRDRSPVGIEDV